MQVSPETIYRSLFVQSRGVLKRRLLQQLRRQHHFRHARAAARRRPWDPMDRESMWGPSTLPMRRLLSGRRIRRNTPRPAICCLSEIKPSWLSRFDADALRLMGESVVVAPEVATVRSLGAAVFSASNTGDLSYQAGGSCETSELMWVDRAGNLLESIGMPGEYDNFAVSPDESRLVVEVPDSTTGTADLWIRDLTSGGMQRFTFDPSDDRLPIWSSDGQSIIFSSARGSGPLQLWQKPTSGVGEAAMVLATDENAVPISSDGERLVFGFGENRSTGGSGEVGVLDLSGDTEAVRMRLTPAGFAAYHYDLSLDGRWIAYVSDESGQPEACVQPFPPSGGKWQVSVDRRWQPKWSADGTELFSLQPADPIHAVDVDADGDTFAIRRPRMLFRSPNFIIKSSTTITTRSLLCLEGWRPTPAQCPTTPHRSLISHLAPELDGGVKPIPS